MQRCAVRLTYAKPTTKGLWKAHGKYIARESATREGAGREMGFDHKEDGGIDIASRLDGWQQASDPRLWKIIISPEFGERVDLKLLTRDVMRKMSHDLNTGLEWVAAAHFNTEHPHVHVALRGVDAHGREFRLDPEYIKTDIRHAAEKLCTNQIGYRTQEDARHASEKEVTSQRFTNLDRAIKRQAIDRGGHFSVALDQPHRTDHVYVVKRLWHLVSMGLAEAEKPGTWKVEKTFEETLRAMSRVADRQRTLADHGAAISDPRLRIEMLSMRSLSTIEGRVLVHGEDDNGKGYMMVEGTEAKIWCVTSTPEVEKVREDGGLRPDSFIRLSKHFHEGKPQIELSDLGTARTILDDDQYFMKVARKLARNYSGSTVKWGGWLGKYHSRLDQAITTYKGKDRSQTIG